MPMKTPRTTALVATLALAMWAAAVMLAQPAPQSVPLPPGHRRLLHDREAFQKLHFQVEGGSEAAAKAYYQDTVAKHLNFMTRDTIIGSSSTDLLAYFGYTNITPSELHRLSSDELMARGAAVDILATRYFAPKITEVSETPTAIPPGGFGWRKLVRFKARPQSAADTNGIESLLFLQNTFEATATGDPFDPKRNVSLFNQVILVRRGSVFSDTQHPLYFMTYGELVRVKTILVDNKTKKLPQPDLDANGQFVDAGILNDKLAATFDEKDRDPETNLGPNDYYVPDSCATCHGGAVDSAKVNFLDTDHWVDRVVPNYNLTDAKFSLEDFTELTKSQHRVLYDANGKDEGSPEHQKAFGVIRLLNDEAKAQNERVDPTGFQFAAASRWVDLHGPAKFGDKHAPPPERGIGTPTWDPGNESHRKLLYYLNRYCYRCHSSVAYNVFDFNAVRDIGAPFIRKRLLDLKNATRWMPQDRIFPGLQGTLGQPTGTATGDLKEFLDLLEALPPQ